MIRKNLEMECTAVVTHVLGQRSSTLIRFDDEECISMDDYDDVVQKMIDNYQSYVDEKTAFGTVDRWSNGIRLKEVSHIITDIKLVNKEILVSFKVLDTDNGRILRNLILNEVPIKLFMQNTYDKEKGEPFIHSINVGA